MAFYGLTAYDRCIELLKVFKKENKKEIEEEELAKYIAKYIGSSKHYKTIRNYINMMLGFGMIIKKNDHKFTINYKVLENDKS